MNRRQKAVLTKFFVVITITALMVTGMVNFKDWVNRSEALRAMEHMGKIVLRHRKEKGVIPSESYIITIKEQLEGHARLGDIQYRALWIDSESSEDEILAYVEHNFRSLFIKEGFIVLFLDGRVNWMDKQEFKTLLRSQQSPMEIEALQK